ncbi:MAG: aldehyde dehydrogenase family protein, partial [Phycisphaerae bacterium]
MLQPYRPEPYVNFAESGPREKMLAALAVVRGQLGKKYPLWIGDRKIHTESTIDSIMPADPKTVVGHVAKANRDHAEQAMKVATETFKTWSRVDPETRARVLFKAAAIMRRRVYELSAWMCFEVSKSWIEAYADVCETI